MLNLHKTNFRAQFAEETVDDAVVSPIIFNFSPKHQTTLVQLIQSPEANGKFVTKKITTTIHIHQTVQSRQCIAMVHTLVQLIESPGGECVTIYTQTQHVCDNTITKFSRHCLPNSLSHITLHKITTNCQTMQYIVEIMYKCFKQQ